MPTITGTIHCNTAQLNTINRHYNNELYLSVQIGVYSSTSELGVVVTDVSGNILGTDYIDTYGCIMPPYQHLI